MVSLTALAVAVLGIANAVQILVTAFIVTSEEVAGYPCTLSVPRTSLAALALVSAVCGVIAVIAVRRGKLAIAAAVIAIDVGSIAGWLSLGAVADYSCFGGV